MQKNKEWNLITDSVPLKGSWNMAVDDFLFHSLGDDPVTYVRFYAWERPTVSLGYSQSLYKVVDVEFCNANGIDIVRRLTGGKLVLHHEEVTYSVCSSDERMFTATLQESYKMISEALMCGLEKMGLHPYLAETPPSSYVRGTLPCFSFPARNEIEINGKKIIGSAQKRMGKRFLQHGSIPGKNNEEMLKSVSFMTPDSNNIRMMSLSEALGRDVGFDEVVACLTEGISDYFGVILRPKIFTEEERKEIQKILKERHDNPEWIFLRE